MSFSLIVPAAANRPEYRDTLPPIFCFNEKGIANCIEAILGLDLNQFSSVYYTVLKQHDELYDIADMLRKQLDGIGLTHAKIVILDSPTSSQAATVYETIVCRHITGPVFIKDADSCFRAEIFPHNGIVVFPLEKLSQVNPQHKSYVAVDDMQFITNTIEKRVIDHYFNAGGYCFEDAYNYCNYYNRYAGMKGLYLSHIVYAMLLDKSSFRPFVAEDYKDMELGQRNNELGRSTS